MEEQKFCKFCGESINPNSVVCPKCGRQLELLKNEDNTEKKEEVQPKFYERDWFMWLMLIILAPVGIVLMYNFNKTLNENTKLILSIVFMIFFIWMCV